MKTQSVRQPANQTDRKLERTPTFPRPAIIAVFSVL